MRDLSVIEQQFKAKFNDQLGEAREIEGLISINEKVAFPVMVSQAFDKTQSIELVDDQANLIGGLLFLQSQKVDINSIPEEQFIAFLTEQTTETFSSTNYTFLHDYLIVNKSFVSTYINSFKETSPLWGSFFHIEDLPNIHFTKSKSVTKIELRKNLFIDRTFYKENLEIALKETNPFYRFLKYYHLLEVHFDMHTAEKLKTLINTGNKELEISKTLKEYNREDIERIKSLFLDRSKPDLLVPYLDEVKNYLSIANAIFYVHGKDSNPLKAKSQFDNIVNGGGFSESNVNRILGNSTFANKIPSIAAYWIYRIRSSIAHNKLGEYLMTANDEEFIVEFAEPLIKELVIQSYSL